MSSYPVCRECGSDLNSMEEQEQELCEECQEKLDIQVPEKICTDGSIAVERR
jgi:DNA-directed RNA polymerase subunit RPC12/RpoP